MRVSVSNWRSGLVAAIPFAIVSLTACGGTPCEQLYDKAVECQPEMSQVVARAEFLQRCGAEEAKVGLDCASKDDCTSFGNCYKAAQAEARKQEAIDKIRVAVAESNWEQARKLCANSSAPADSKDDCGKVVAHFIAAETESIRQAIDSGTPGKCGPLKAAVAQASDEEKAKAKALCEESAWVHKVNWHLQQLEKNTKAGGQKAGATIAQCKDLLAKFSATTYSWTAARTKELATACYITAGKPWTLARLKIYKRSCIGDDETLGQGIEKYGIQDKVDPELKKAFTTHAKLCQKERRKRKK